VKRFSTQIALINADFILTADYFFFATNPKSARHGLTQVPQFGQK
jgi:hypothetical protein